MLEQFNESEYQAALKIRIDIAQRHALSPQEYIDSENKNLQAAHVFDRDAMAKELAEILTNPRYVTCKDPREYRVLTELLPELAPSYTHELAHFTTAVTYGFKPIIGIFYVHADAINFRLNIQPFMLLGEIPNDMGKEQYFTALRAVIAAPPHPSDTDVQMLQSI